MAARDQAARIIRTEADDDNVEQIHGAPTLAGTSLDDHSARRTGDTPAKEAPADDTAAASEVTAAKPGKRKFALMGVGALLALAAISYGT
ncbi:MAG: HlyD family secretion protein, partial [Nitrobacter sp.]